MSRSLSRLGYHLPSAPTQSSASFSGLELRVKHELKRKLKQAVQKIKIIIRALVIIYYKHIPTGT